jgi:hypothetical protein
MLKKICSAIRKFLKEECDKHDFLIGRANRITKLQDCKSIEDIVKINNSIEIDKLDDRLSATYYQAFIDTSIGVFIAEEEISEYKKVVALWVMIDHLSCLGLEIDRLDNKVGMLSRSELRLTLYQWADIIRNHAIQVECIHRRNRTGFSSFFLETNWYFGLVETTAEWQRILFACKRHFTGDGQIDIYEYRECESSPHIYGTSSICKGEKTLGDFFDENNMSRF